jgi:ribosomal protein L11 methyltransferase
MENGWSALDLELPGRLEDEVLAALGSTCLGAEYRPTSGDEGRLVAYFSNAREAGAAAVSVAALLRGKGLDSVAARIGLRPVGDGRWAERYQAGLQPFALGTRFLIDPTASGAHSDERVGIDLVPGGAFGTGEHPTTRLCVDALERHVGSESRWVDLGCGSGLLAVVARHCGAAAVLALDIDPEAVRIAREVMRLNGVAGAVRVAHGTHDAVDPGAWDGVVANIGASYFVESAAELALRLSDGGKLIASGFYEERRAEVRDALVRAGLIEVAGSTHEGWSAMVFRRGTEPEGEGG